MGLGVAPTFAFPRPFLLNCLGAFNILFLDKLNLHFPSHDARHFVVDPVSLLIDDMAALEGVDGDYPKPFEEIPIVDPVAATLKEVVLIGVVVLDEHFPFLIFLTKEGARMRNDLIIEDAGT